MNDDDPLLSRALALTLQHHGIGGPSPQPPAWLRARIGASLLELAAESGATPAEIVARLECDAALRAELAEVLRVGETRFFRDAIQWQALRRTLLPRLSGSRLRALSAGCSTGEEAWTLAMLLDEAANSRPLRVVGLDRSRVALAAAREASYDKDSARELPSELAQRYLEIGADGGLRIGPALRSRVSFTARDLLEGGPPGEFDLVVCKNVLIYLGEDAGRRVLSVLSRALADQGVLLVARSEIPRARSFGLHADEIEPGVVVFRRKTQA